VHQEEHPACKKLSDDVAGMVICLEQCANDLHMVQRMPLSPIISCFIKIPIGFTFLVLAYSGGPGKEAVKRVSVLKVKIISHSSR